MRFTKKTAGKTTDSKASLDISKCTEVSITWLLKSWLQSYFSLIRAHYPSLRFFTPKGIK